MMNYFHSMKLSSTSPIGIFDSGIGGLTVVKSVMEQLPGEDIIYFGDTARVPYGIKSMDTVKEYALQITDFLLKKNVKTILIACNTVAASAEKEIKLKSGNVPVFGVIDSGSNVAVTIGGRKKLIGVIGTLATVNSGAYEKAIKKLNPELSVFSKACPLLVPLAEEGWTDNTIARQVIELYLEDFKQKPMDALILGCTHYPLFKALITETIDNSETAIIDSADAIAASTQKYLSDIKLLNSQKKGTFQCFVSDKPQRFQILAERFLGKSINRVEVVNMG
jgi:glutamate racemase